nr:cilia- and flagella-associated protein 61-like [Leptinotarsa decemlineata]
MSSKSSSSSKKVIKSYTSSKKSVVLSPKNVIRLNIHHTRLLEKLIDPKQTPSLFGEIRLDEILTKCYLALGVQDEDGKLAGALILYPYPNIPAIPQWEWDHWIFNIYGLSETNNRNTLWIHLLLWDPAFYFVFLRPLLQHVFNIQNSMEYCILVIPPGHQRTDFVCNLGNAVLPKDYPKQKTCQYLYMFCRKDFMVKYKIRRAVEEDNDDLVPLIHTHSKKLKDCYGSYYIAEILTRHKDMGRQIIVAEYQGTAVSVLCLNSSVNYKVLNDEFELSPYNGFKKPHPDDFIDLSLEDIRQSLEKLHSKVEDEILEIIDQRSCQFGSRSSEDELLVHISGSESDQFSLVFTSASMFLFQDDEEKEAIPSSLGSDEDSQGLLSQYLELHDKDPRLIELDWVSGYSSSRGKIQKIPEFNGEPNAFALEIAATLPEHEYGLIMLYEAAFECFPGREYCVMSIPSTTPINKLYKYFTRVIPRPTGSFPYELYVMHEKAVLGNVTVEVARREHEKQVKFLLSTIPNYLMVLQHFENCVTHPKSSFYSCVMLCEDQVVGVATITEEFDVNYLQAHYDLHYIDNKIHRVGSHGLIESIILSPIFQRYSQFFLREIHRLCDFSVLYYRHTPYDTTEAYRERPLLNILQTLLPVLPRKQPEYDLKILKAEECAPTETITEKQEPFALYVSTSSLCSVSRHCVNTKIVVVGCSNTSLAFLEALIFRQSLNYLVTFNNVTLHCPTGLAYTKVANRIRDSFMVKKKLHGRQIYGYDQLQDLHKHRTRKNHQDRSQGTTGDYQY